MKICFLGLDNLTVLTPDYREHGVGGEAVQQTLLARGLARKGHDVSMVTLDYGQADGAMWDTIRVFRAYRPDAGVPVLRFVHPRWTGIWSALARADADIYYTSCAGMHVGLLALFCRQSGRRFVYRAASDADCDRARVRIFVRFARDRWLYAHGLKRADALLVQSAAQARMMARSFGLASRVAGMLVEKPLRHVERDIDVLWVGNLKRVKRPDRVLELARALPRSSIHMVGGESRGEKALFDDLVRAVPDFPNMVFHNALPYAEANLLYDRARLLVSTSDVEGFPNVYLQAWIRGVPVVALLDPDGVIRREGLGIAVAAAECIPDAIRSLLEDPAAWRAASARCRAFMDREYGEERILADYTDAFDDVLRADAVVNRALYAE